MVQSPTSEEEPLGSNGQQPNCHHQQQQQSAVDGTSSSLEEAAGRCGTPSHRQSRRRRPLSTEPALSGSSAAVKPASGRNLAPPAPTTPVKSHYKVLYGIGCYNRSSTRHSFTSIAFASLIFARLPPSGKWKSFFLGKDNHIKGPGEMSTGHISRLNPK